MMNLKGLSKLNFKANNIRYVVPLASASFLGFLDAAYLTVIHYKNIIPPCSFAHGCETVLSSHYASIMGIPMAIFGMLFYIGMLGVTIIYFQNPGKKTFLLVSIAAAVGLVVSAILFYIQAVLLHAFCQYCLASEAVTIVIAITILIRYLSAREVIIERLM